uniref:ISWI chromatin-remodeling complex ATPase ISW1 n=1 Tax=Parastrongyloides trichosuri TaxID=131310 RepID=A0A0N4ZN96_PARTI
MLPENPIEDKLKEIEKTVKTRVYGNLSDNRLNISDKIEINNDRRHFLKEEEEDKTLLEEAEKFDDIFCFQSSPEYITGGIMRDYQIRGLNWLISLEENNINGILADEMGLGKTLQTISLLGYMKHYKGINGPFLIILPKSTLANWENEFNKWCPTISTVVLKGTSDERSDIINNKILTSKFEVLLTNYELVMKSMSVLQKFYWQYIIIDEGHRIKNDKSKLSECVRKLKSKNRLLITGTPLQNDLHELWSLLNFLMPEYFSDSEAFDSLFSAENCLNNNDEIVKKLHKILQPFLLRRIKSDVETTLLPKKELKVYVNLSEMQRKYYQNILTKNLEIITAQGKKEKSRLMNILMHLRKCCNHPYLFDGAEPGPPYFTGSHLIYNSGKMILLDKLLSRLKEQGSRVLIFSQMARMLDILCDYCWMKKYDYCRLDGQTSYEAREENIKAFNKPGSEKFIFLLTTRAGGLGINLTTADVVILYDSDWNPQMDLQAMDRAHRIGQTKQVRVFRLVTQNSVEERIQKASEKKLVLDSIVIQQGRGVNNKKGFSGDDMLNAIRYDCNRIMAGDGDTITDEDIDTILKRSEEKTSENEGELKKLKENSLRYFSMDNNTDGVDNLYKFEGEDFSMISKKSSDKFVFEMPKRERRNNIYANMQFPIKKEKDTKYEMAMPKQVQIKDYQFFPKKLIELQEREMNYYRQVRGLDIDIPSKMDGKSKKEIAKIRKELQKKIDEALPLTIEEQNLKKELIKQGYGNWGKKEFNHFIKACEKYGREDYEAITTEIGTKTYEEVVEYSKVFFERIHELHDCDRIIDQIVKGERAIERRIKNLRALELRVSKYKSPYFQFRINYLSGKSRTWNEDQDRFILLKFLEYGGEGEGVYNKIHQDIVESNEFMFDYFMLSKNVNEIQKRIHSLLRLIDIDMNGKNDDNDNINSKEKKSRKRKNSESLNE